MTPARKSQERATDTGQLPPEGRDGKRLVVHGVVDDPNPVYRGQKQKAAFNRASDALGLAYSSGRIDDAQYLAGRVYERLMADTGPSGGGQWAEGDKVDAVISRELKICFGLDRARKVQDFRNRVAQYLSLREGVILHLALSKSMSIQDIATAFGEKKGRGSNEIANLFYTGLENLSVMFSTRANKF